MAAPLRTTHATVSKVNGHGFQTAEQPGVWLNLSKYADPPPVVPPVGTECELGLDAGGYVREIRVAAQPGPPASQVQSQRVTAPLPPAATGSPAGGHTTVPPAQENWSHDVTNSAVCYERAQLYAACLQAAATVHNGAPIEDLEALADRFFRRAVSVGTRK